MFVGNMDQSDSNEVGETEEVMEQEDDSSASESEEENYEKEILEIQEKLKQSPYSYDLHVQLIKVLSQAGELDPLREAREHMRSIYPLTEELWLDWLRDEIKVSSTNEDREKIENLFEKAVLDYQSVPLWLEYVQFCIGGMGSDEGIKKIRSVFEKALTAVGLHVSQGNNIWEAYREFENALLTQLLPQPGTEVTKDQEDAFNVQNKRLDSIFKRQLAIPLLGMEETLQEYKDWSGCEVDQKTMRAYSKALVMVKKLTPLEDALSSAASPRWKEYQAIIEFEKKEGDPVRIQLAFERAIQENCLSPDIWSQYTKYLDFSLKIKSIILPVYERALRNCPWSSPLWQNYLLALERHGESFDKVKETVDKALMAGFTQSADYLLVWTTYCDFLRRRIDWNTDHKSELDLFRETIASAIDHLTENFGKEGDPNGFLRSYWALIEAKFCKNMEKARELWNGLMTEGHGNTAAMWLDYYRLDRAYGNNNKHCRRILQKAVNSVTDWPESIAEAYVNFEREEGTLEQFDQAVAKCESQLQRIKERKEQAAEKEHEESQKSGKAGKKFTKNADKSTNKGKKTSPKMDKSAVRGNDVSRQEQSTTVKRKIDESGDGLKDDESFKVPMLPGFKEDAARESMIVQHDSSKNIRTVFVSNIRFDLDEDRIKEIFSKCGNITDVRLVKNFKGKSKGYAYVEFEDELCVTPALAKDREMVEGRPMFVSRCEDRQGAKAEFKFSTDMETNKLFIKGLPFTCTVEALRTIFSQHGELKDVRLVTYRNGTPKGLAYVEYCDESHAAHAVLKTDGIMIGEHQISVAISNPPARKMPETIKGEGDRVPSLGGGKKESEFRGKARTQVSLIPRSLQHPQSSSQTTVNTKSVDKQSVANGQSSSNKSMSNADFRNMLLKK
ncbi:squamous cell carcinoma antigen recognized by T-cells 3-like isoform X2 [Gigantopelta aegis]|uniref:squamous cell carcinoma antigen recognized by T-cells 3-like isoform X2 n=1 Tax=Gigantopelta aegis TaxID=1735272 RepID=UPI001B88B2D3|nr:squamous cell carcinoma antigen recognized by T-cells 3-like isoform X2 [Gigantopelta aegis]